MAMRDDKIRLRQVKNKHEDYCTFRNVLYRLIDSDAYRNMDFEETALIQRELFAVEECITVTSERIDLLTLKVNR